MPTKVNEKNAYDEQFPEMAETEEDLYEPVNNDKAAYEEFELTSVQKGVQQDETNEYVNIVNRPRGRKNILKTMEHV